MAQWIKPNINLDFVSNRNRFFLLSTLLILASIGILIFNVFVRGSALNYGTDFRGGSQIQIAMKNKTSIDDLRKAIKDAGFVGSEVVKMNGDANYPNLFLLRLTEIASFSTSAQEKILAAVKSQFGDSSAIEYSSGSDKTYIKFPTAGANQETAEQEIAEQEIDSAKDDATVASLKKIFSDSNVGVQNIQRFGRAEDRRFEVTLGGLGDKLRASIDNRIGAGSVVDIPQVESVGAKMGQKLRTDGIKSVIYALAFMLLYIALRFDFRYAPGAIVALAHDVIITIGIFGLTWIEFSLPVVAALLTIAGYSINDTIVVYDRIRENVVKLRDRKFPLVVNKSINETLSRTLLTSLTTLFTCIAILIMGEGVLKSFAVALTVGVLVGTYSSVFVASPLVVLLNKKLVTSAPGVKKPKRA